MKRLHERPGRRSLSDAEAAKRASLAAAIADLPPPSLTPRERAAIASRVKSGRIAQRGSGGTGGRNRAGEA